MTLRKKIFIIAGIVIGILLALILLIAVLIDRKNNGGETPIDNTEQQTQPNTVTTGGNLQTATNAVIEGRPEVEQEPNEVYVKQLAGIFVERFYSFSNQNDNSHITDALLMSTEKMAGWIKTQATKQESEYSGQTTRIFSSTVEKFSVDYAKVLIGVSQSVISKGSDQEVVTFKDGVVELVNVNGEWKVDRVTWEQT